MENNNNNNKRITSEQNEDPFRFDLPPIQPPKSAEFNNDISLKRKRIEGFPEFERTRQLEEKLNELTSQLMNVTNQRDQLNLEVTRLKSNIKNMGSKFKSFLAQFDTEFQFIEEPTTNSTDVSFNDDSMNQPISLAPETQNISSIEVNSVILATDLPSNVVGKATTQSKFIEFNFLTRFSGELVLQILGYVSKRDILELALACKEWKEIIYNTAHLWRKLEWRDITNPRRSLDSILELLNSCYYFRWLHEIDFGHKAQKVPNLDEAQHFHSKELQQLSKTLHTKCKWIKVLKICVARLYDATIKSFADHCPNLQNLIFESSKKTLFTDVGLAYLVSLPYLTSLSLPSSEHYSDRGISRLIKKIGEQMHCFEFYFLPGVHQTFTDNAIKFISQYCTNLQSITIHGHEGLTEKSLEYLSKGCVRLSEINFSHSPNLLTENSLTQLASSCRLQSIDLSYCQLNDSKLVAFAKHSREAIVKITLNGNNQLTDDGIEKLASYSPKLEMLSVLLCGNLTNNAIISMKARCQNISLVDAKGTAMTEDV